MLFRHRTPASISVHARARCKTFAAFPLRSITVAARGAFVTTFPGAITSELDIVAVSHDDERRSSTFPAVPAEIRDRILHPRSGEESRRELHRQQDTQPEP